MTSSLLSWHCFPPSSFLSPSSFALVTRSLAECLMQLHLLTSAGPSSRNLCGASSHFSFAKRIIMQAAYGRWTTGMHGYEGFALNCGTRTTKEEIGVLIPMISCYVNKETITTHPWSPARDRALKIDVVQAGGNPIAAAMREWVEYYNAPQNPVPPRPPQYYQQRLADLYSRLTEKAAHKREVDIVASNPAPVPTHAHKHYEKKRGALYARLARKQALKIKIAKLDELRKRAVAASTRQWPPSRSHPLHPDNLALEATRQREEMHRVAQEEARRAAEASERRAEAEARVAHLVELREAGRFRLAKRFL
ncbi:hypothetical protein R3P38DRAFT_3254501 [Favolaschia claudopus]|uniref:Uncharacterized protein n=1 Tax=Favolaschia claudopus TaxID=2862362 RepID=A0AAW0DSL4_9AGAR